MGGAPPARRQCRVAVVGAGAAGLVAARELRREGHEVVVFEAQAELGGTWVYTDEVESDELGADPARRRVHSSMYQGLTTNLPRTIMGFAALPFTPSAMRAAGVASVDGRMYPCAEEVLAYLHAYAQRYDLAPLVRFNARITRAAPLRGGGGGAGAAGAAPPPWPRWRVEWSAPGGGGAEDFDALVVANGHYSEPHLPEPLPGAAAFPGAVLHSHSFRRAERFAGQVVAVVGASFSGLDIARLVAAHAAGVIVCAREWRTPRDLARASARLGLGAAGAPGAAPIEARGMITALTPAGGAEFAAGAGAARVDAVILATGYEYEVPFLDLPALGLSAAGQRVAPLFQHMFAPGLGPGLAFIGLPWRVVPFPLFELQSNLCARLLSGRASLPPADEMAAWAAAHAASLAAEGLPPSRTHYLDHKQLTYHAWLARRCGRGVTALSGWRAVVLHGFWVWRWLLAAAARLRRRRR
ncbi:FMO GS-OX-like 3 [Scenedesmus sp. PABB004]|nr:FMO GS-OX-like 3 [Scenedesmus sp. PABB004]